MGSKTFDGVRFSVYPNDHFPPHVHGSANGVRVILDLLPNGTVAKSKRIDAVSPKNAKRNIVLKVERVASTKVQELIALWRKRMALSNVLTTDQEIDAALERARHVPDLPDAVSVKYDHELDAVVIHLAGGRRLLLPREELQGLENATQNQLAEIEIHGGRDIAWPQLDVDHYLPSLVAGQYGSSKWMRNLEMRGVSSDPVNTYSAVTKLRAFHALDPLLAPFGSVQGQKLLGVCRIAEQELSVGVQLIFENKSLRVMGLADDSIDVTLTQESCPDPDLSSSIPWNAYVGKSARWMWLAMNQQGYIDTVLLAFEDVVVPELALTVVASELKTRRLTL